MSHKYEKLKTLLKELFQLDQPDLDFGLYRIMHAKADEVTQFLDKDLLPQVQAELANHESAEVGEMKKALADRIELRRKLGDDPNKDDEVQRLKKKVQEAGDSPGQIEGEVYDHLYSFFRRYYSEGDFLAKRVYKPGVYAIPYEGEEVKIHWANKDQYYIKTSEYLRDYAFRLRPDDEKNPMRVHFSLTDAVEDEHGNVKAAEGKDRVFILAVENCIAEANGDLFIRFAYRPATLADWPEDVREGKTKPPAQKELLDIAEKSLVATGQAELAAWLKELCKLHTKTDGEQAEYSRLRAHLNRYTARNTFDYFIHKDLGEFLRRELDFYIKNEVMHLDDVESESTPRVEQYLSKIKVIRRIAGKIIDFLAQLEDFQKKLWLKKKFVVETHYCITLNRIPEEFYPEIITNDAQREEWVKLFAINEIEGDQKNPGYSVPLTTAFLKANSTMAVDTRHFSHAVVSKLLEALGEVGSLTDGLLIRSDNFSALSIIQPRYRGKVKCVYIDPPYNTGGDGFAYKDTYQHSSWMSMMEQCASRHLPLMKPEGAVFVSINDIEINRLKLLLDPLMTPVNTVTVKTKLAGVSGSHHGKSLRNATEHILIYAIDGERFFFTDLVYDKQELSEFIEEMESAGKSWKYTTVLDSVDDGTYVKSILDGSGGEIRVFVHKKYSFKSINAIARERHNGDLRAAYRHNLNTIFRTTNAQSSIRQRVCDETKELSSDLISITYVPRTGRSAGKETRLYYKDSIRNLVTFLRDVVVVEDNIVYKIISSGNLWTDIQYNNIASEGGVSFPNGKKPLGMISKIVNLVSESDDIILDYFAGSGTTGHAVINLNREDGGHRRFVLVEMGEHFDTALLPRIKKVTFSPEWKDIKPKRFASKEEGVRSPRIVKVMHLESYEDALNNLELQRTKAQQSLLETFDAQGADTLREQYLLRYMLDVETHGSQSLLNVKSFSDPAAYKLKVKRPASDESIEVNVDLLETFNWLLGLTVRHIAAPQTFIASFERNREKRLCLKGRLKQDADGPFWFRRVEGLTPDGRRTLVVWRKFTGDQEQDNLVLDHWMKDKLKISTKDFEFDLIYVNGDNNLENLKAPDDTWKVRLIEEDFHRLMFDMEGV